jgi:hypothetical protein
VVALLVPLDMNDAQMALVDLRVFRMIFSSTRRSLVYYLVSFISSLSDIWTFADWLVLS